jgi:hypothetical protein
MAIIALLRCPAVPRGCCAACQDAMTSAAGPRPPGAQRPGATGVRSEATAAGCSSLRTRFPPPPQPLCRGRGATERRCCAGATTLAAAPRASNQGALLQAAAEAAPARDAHLPRAERVASVRGLFGQGRSAALRANSPASGLAGALEPAGRLSSSASSISGSCGRAGQGCQPKAHSASQESLQTRGAHPVGCAEALDTPPHGVHIVAADEHVLVGSLGHSSA